MACAFSHEQLTSLEHRWAWGQYYGPPSTDGAWFELYRRMLINEFGSDTLMIGQALPREEAGDALGVHDERAGVGLRSQRRAGVLVTVSADKSFLMWRQIDFTRHLDQAGKDYLLVVSRPPAVE